MADMVRKDPAAPVGQAIKAIKIACAEENGDDEEVFNDVVGQIMLRLLRVRDSIIGEMPKSF